MSFDEYFLVFRRIIAIVTQVPDFLRITEIQETECLLTSVICVPIKLLKWRTF